MCKDEDQILPVRPLDLDELQNLAKKIHDAHTKDNHSCVATCQDGNRIIFVANGFVAKGKQINQLRCFPRKNLGNASIYSDDTHGFWRPPMHAEMAIVRELCYIRNVKKVTDIQRGMFSQYSIGVSKEVCEKCANVLNFLGIQHKSTHSRKTYLEHWELPLEIFKKTELGPTNDGLYLNGEDRDDSPVEEQAGSYGKTHIVTRGRKPQFGQYFKDSSSEDEERLPAGQHMIYSSSEDEILPPLSKNEEEDGEDIIETIIPKESDKQLTKKRLRKKSLRNPTDSDSDYRPSGESDKRLTQKRLRKKSLRAPTDSDSDYRPSDDEEDDEDIVSKKLRARARARKKKQKP